MWGKNEVALGGDKPAGDTDEVVCLRRVFRRCQEAIEIETDGRHAEIIVSVADQRMYRRGSAGGPAPCESLVAHQSSVPRRGQIRYPFYLQAGRAIDEQPLRCGLVAIETHRTLSCSCTTFAATHGEATTIPSHDGVQRLRSRGCLRTRTPPSSAVLCGRRGFLDMACSTQSRLFCRAARANRSFQSLRPRL